MVRGPHVGVGRVTEGVHVKGGNDESGPVIGFAFLLADGTTSPTYVVPIELAPVLHEMIDNAVTAAEARPAKLS